MFFWKNWNTNHRTAYWTGLVLLITTMIGLVWAWALGLRNVVHWNVLSELVELPATIDSFTDGLFDYPIPGTLYVVTEQFVSSSMQINLLAARLVTLGVCLGLAFILAAVTRLDRRPYLIAMTTLIVLIATVRLETLQLPSWIGSGFNGRLPLILLVLLYGTVSYYFHAFQTASPLPVRLVVFTTLTTLGWLTVGRLSSHPFPALALLSYAMPGLLLISFGFIFWISGEIIAALVFITSAPRRNGAPLGFVNFLSISILYLLNLVLVWLSNTRAISWSPVIISPFILLLLSVVLGIWGVRQYWQQTESGSLFRDSGAFLYIGLAMITLLTLTCAIASANDPLVEAIEDMIVYTHLGVGAVFVVYVVLNFLPLYREGLPVYRVLYKPLQFSMLQTRLLAVLVVTVLLTTQQFFPLSQSFAGYFNNLGDLYAATQEVRVAEQYYKRALQNEFQNHKSNYALASLALSQQDKVTAAYYFQQALLKHPSPQAYAALSALLLQDNLFFEAIKMLQQGIQRFPNSGELQNNLGYLYAKTRVTDSSYYYFAASTGNLSRKDVPQTNLLALWARHPRLLSLDSLIGVTKARPNESFEANRSALMVLQGPAITTTTQTLTQRPAWLNKPLTDKRLSVGMFAHLYNYAIGNRTSDTTLLAILQGLEQNPVNQHFVDDLLFARAVAHYYTGNSSTAFELADQVGRDNTQTGALYRSVLGLWMIQQGLFAKAAKVFSENADTLSIYYRALALTKAGAPLLAQPLWEIAGHNDPSVQALAQVLYGKREPKNDTELAFCLLVDLSIAPSRQQVFYQSMTDPNLKTVVAATLIRRYLNDNQVTMADRWYEQLPPNTHLSDYASSIYRIATLRILLARRQFDLLLSTAKQPVVSSLQAEKEFLLAQVYQAKRQVAESRRHYTSSLQRCPFRAETVMAAAQFEQQAGHVEKAYQLVLNALTLNETHPGLLKVYTLLCLDLSLTDYAEEGLVRLRAATSPADYQTFMASYQTKRALIEKQRQAFQ